MAIIGTTLAIAWVASLVFGIGFVYFLCYLIYKTFFD